MACALREAEKAAQMGEVPVGAVVVCEGAAIGRGHNLVESRGSATAHAEMIALAEAARAIGDWRLAGSTLYATIEPCPMCAGAIILSRVGTLVYGAADAKFGACGSVVNLFSENAAWNHRVSVVSGVRADESTRLLREFFAERRKNP
jgi:tRNA(adenine34) deaminase